MPSVFSGFHDFDQFSPLTGDNNSFVPNFNTNTSFQTDGSISLGSLSGDFGSIIKFVRHRLGASLLEVEISPDSIGVCFEEANLKFSSIVNSYFITSWFASVLGISKNYNQFDFSNALPKSNNIFVQAFAANLTNPLQSGNTDKRKGYLDVVVGQSTYDFYSDSMDETGVPLEQYIASVSGYDVHLIQMFFGNSFYMNKFYDPNMNNQWLQSEFGFPSQGIGDTLFYILPLNNDILRGMEQKASDYTRKPEYRYMKYGRNIQFTPKSHFGQGSPRIWYEYYIDQSPGTEQSPLARGSFSGLDYLSQARNQVATNFGNVPVQDLDYGTCNPVGKSWIREYCFACCLETLGWTRNKFTSWSIPGGETVTLNGSELASAGQTRRTELITQLNTFLDNIDGYKMMEKEAAKTQQMIEILKGQPMPIYLM